MHELIKKIEDIAKQDIECMAAKGYDHIDRKCFGEAVDVLKDAMQMKYFAAETMKACLETEYMKDIKIPNKIHEGELTERMLEEYDSNPDFGVMGNGRYGYDHYRYKNGRFAPKGRGTRRGYTPYLHMMPEMDEYEGMYDEIPYPMTGYRMGYTHDGRNMSHDGNMDGRSMNRPSRYGESYDRYDTHRRHYHNSKDAESKKQMDESIREVFDDMENVVQDVWKEMTPEQKQKYKMQMTQLVQKMQ